MYDDYSQLTFMDMINILDEPYRVIIVLRFFEQMPLKDIAQLLELNENTVKTRLYRGLYLLKIDLEDIER